MYYFNWDPQKQSDRFYRYYFHSHPDYTDTGFDPIDLVLDIAFNLMENLGDGYGTDREGKWFCLLDKHYFFDKLSNALEKSNA